MEKTIAKRTGEFRIQKTDRGSRTAMVEFEINGRKAEMAITDGWGNARMLNWGFVTDGDAFRLNHKVMTDFTAFDVFDIEVDIEGILAEAKAAFTAETEKEEEQRKEAFKRQREAAYSQNWIINGVKPALETKGHQVKITTTKEQYIGGEEIRLSVDGLVKVGYDYKGNIHATNGLYNRSCVEKTTKSTKVEKVVETIIGVVTSEKRRIADIDEAKANLATAKERIEAILGVELEEKAESHSNGMMGAKYRSWTTPYFSIKGNDKLAGLKIKESSVWRNGESIKGVTISNLPMFTHMDRLKRIVDLLNE